MTPIADMVEKLLLAGVAAELVVLAVRTAEMACERYIPKKKAADSVKERKASRIDPQWAASQADLDYATSLGMQQDRIVMEGNKFRDYWVSCANRSAVKLDWSAAWRNWCRRVMEDKPQLAAPKKRTYEEALAAATPDQIARAERFARKTNGTRSLFDLALPLASRAACVGQSANGSAPSGA